MGIIPGPVIGGIPDKRDVIGGCGDALGKCGRKDMSKYIWRTVEMQTLHSAYIVKSAR